MPDHPAHIATRILGALRLGYPLTINQLMLMLDESRDRLEKALAQLRMEDRAWKGGWIRTSGKRRERLWVLNPAESIPRASDWACR
jgi:hypothetical protein